MSESVLERLPIPNDNDHSPPKKLRLDPSSSSSHENISVQNVSPPEIPFSPSNSPTDEDFDPVQAILDAGKRCREEEKRRSETSFKQSSSKTIQEKKEYDVVSGEESDEDEDSDTNNETPEKPTSKKVDGPEVEVLKSVKKTGKKKSKSSSFRRNIKDILKPDQLDDLTIAARKEEEERRHRMNLKLQQLQQQQLKYLQEQQTYLLRESLLSSASNYNHPPSNSTSELKKLMRKKHITVSLDGSGNPQPNQDEECILLSSDDDDDGGVCDKPPEYGSVPSFHQQLQPTSCVPSQMSELLKNQTVNRNTTEQIQLASPNEDIIALSSDDENYEHDRNLPSSKDARLYVGALRVDNVGDTNVGIDSDDDCVIVSPVPEGDEEVEEKDECSQDLLNVPDHLGRVLVNVGHPEEDTDLFLASQIAKIVKPHQIGGIRFLYDNVVESKERYNESAGFGCILAHAMGLGKTLQTVAFCDVLLRTVGKTVLIIVPINTIQNWLNEFNRYLPSKDTSCSNNRVYVKKRNVKNKVKQPECVPNGNSSSNGSPEKLGHEMTDDSSAIVVDPTLNLGLYPNANIFNLLENQSSSSPPPSSSNTLNNHHHHHHENQTPLLDTSEPATPSEPTPPVVETDTRHFETYLLNETVKSLQARERIITTWASKGGVLLLGYEMYRMLALKRLKKSSRKVLSLDHEERVAEAESLDRIYDCLVEPGPDCVICDEGHRIKNSGAGISQALKAIKTKRRVVLTGYPLQNNLMEYWCMVDFVRPNYLGTKAEFSNMFERPIQNGQCADSTLEDKRLMKYRSHVLHSLLEGFVQRRSHLVLRNALPQKEEWVFLVKLTTVQLRIYREFIRYLREDLDSDNASANPIKAFAVCCKIWNHPDVLWNVVKKNLDLELDLDIDEVRTIVKPNKPRGTGRPRGRPPLNGISLSSHGGSDQFDGPMFTTESTSGYKAETSGMSLEWAKPLFENYIPEVMENGVKFELLFQLLEETVSVGDKLLVFSQSLLTLDLIEVFLKKRLSWRKSFDYVRLDGSTARLEREKLINEFNTSSVQKLFLISTRAGSLGINLVGANRVCIFDASWNPCHDSQAVCRIYRYGQTKPCHIYRFVSDCTLEKRIYDRQVNKKGMADRIVDEMNPNAPFKSKDVSSFLVLQHELLDKLPFIKCDLNMDKFTDPVMRNVLTKMGDRITQEPFEHESLLIDQKHQRLSKSEKRLALKNYEKEKQTVANAYASYSRPSYTQYYSSINPLATSSSSPSSQPPSYNQSSYSRYNSHRSTGSSSSMQKSSSVLSSSLESHRSIGSSSFDRFELHINALKSRGISVYPVELHQDTYLNDPSGAQDMYIRAGEKVYILVSQKGTYLRVQGKLLRVPFVGTEMNQKQAELFVMSLLQRTSSEDRRSTLSMSHVYPVEQQLPPSNTLFQKNANHLQITNSRNNSGGDVMMAASSWNTSTSGSSSSSSNLPQPQQQSSLPGTSLNLNQSLYLNDDFTSKNGTYSNQASHSQTDLQSLTRLAETFCQIPPSADLFSNSDSSKQWAPSPSTPKRIVVEGTFWRKILCILIELMVILRLGIKTVPLISEYFNGTINGMTSLAKGAYVLYLSFYVVIFYLYQTKTKCFCEMFNNALSLSEKLCLKERSPDRIQCVKRTAKASCGFVLLYILYTIALFGAECLKLTESRNFNVSHLTTNSTNSSKLSKRNKLDVAEIYLSHDYIFIQIGFAIASCMNIGCYMMSFLALGVLAMFIRQLILLFYWKIQVMDELGQFFKIPHEIRTFNKIGNIIDTFNQHFGLMNLIASAVVVTYISTSVEHVFSGFQNFFKAGAGLHLLLSYIPTMGTALIIADVTRVAGLFAGIIKHQFGKFTNECGDPAECLCGIAIVHYDLATSNIGFKGLGFLTVSYQFITTILSMIVTYSIVIVQMFPQEDTQATEITN